MAHFVQGSNPRDHLRLPNYTWIWPANTLLLGIKPFAQHDWPLPTPLAPPIIQNNIRLLITPTISIASLPFNQYDWQLPQKLPYVDYNYTETSSFRITSTLNPFAFEWNFTPDDYRIDQTWIQNLVLTTLKPPPPPPFKQTDYPLPRSPLLPIDQFWFNNNRELPKISVNKPTTQYNWPLPKDYLRIDEFIGFSMINTLPPPPAPPPPSSIGSGRYITEKEVYSAIARKYGSIGGFAKADAISADKRAAVAAQTTATRRKK